ncbi:MAG: SH3 domain-containing protein, partial [Lachnospiraceae bacterium]|nr:SH3 domain-containing protein [Lachnospiraceae bacterium]
MMKRAGRNVWYAMAGMLIFMWLGVPVRATEGTMTLQQTTKDVEVKETPDQNSNTVSELPAGTGVIVYGEPQNSWSQIEYAGVNGYVKSSALRAYPVDGSAEELEPEVEEVQEDTPQVTDEQETEEETEQESEQAPVIAEENDSESSASETYIADDSTEELDQEFEEVR